MPMPRTSRACSCSLATSARPSAHCDAASRSETFFSKPGMAIFPSVNGRPYPLQTFASATSFNALLRATRNSTRAGSPEGAGPSSADSASLIGSRNFSSAATAFGNWPVFSKLVRSSSALTSACFCGVSFCAASSRLGKSAGLSCSHSRFAILSGSVSNKASKSSPVISSRVSSEADGFTSGCGSGCISSASA